jgi:hypothetical protein
MNEEEEEEDLFVFNDVIEGPRVPDTKNNEPSNSPSSLKTWNSLVIKNHSF